MRIKLIASRIAHKLLQTASRLRPQRRAEQRLGVSGAPHSVSDLSRHFGRKLVIADVGCRWGFADIWMRFLPHVSLYGFDPDESECERLRELYRGRDVTLVSKALADSPSQRTLYFTREPACSSLYQPDPQLTRTMPELACATEIGTQSISVTTLDHWAASDGVNAVDFLKLDTQGSELDILKGGSELLRTIRVLEIEVEFNPIYLSQPLFGDIDQFLRERGFVLWRLSNLSHYSRGEPSSRTQEAVVTHYDSVPVESPAFGGQLYWGHAFYVKSGIASGNVDAGPSQSIRDAALMFSLGFRDLGVNLLRAAATKGGPLE